MRSILPAERLLDALRLTPDDILARRQAFSMRSIFPAGRLSRRSPSAARSVYPNMRRRRREMSWSRQFHAVTRELRRTHPIGMTARRTFESLSIWHDARALTREVYSLTSLSPWRHDRELSSQIRRAAVSVMSNIAEGFERGGGKEFGRFLAMAKGSAAEVRSQLYVAEDMGYVRCDEAREARQRAIVLSRRIEALRHAAGAPKDAMR